MLCREHPEVSPLQCACVQETMEFKGSCMFMCAGCIKGLKVCASVCVQQTLRFKGSCTCTCAVNIKV